MSIESTETPTQTTQDIANSKQFWRGFLATGGSEMHGAAMRQMRPDYFWKYGSVETICCLDATENLPRGSAVWCKNTIRRP